MVLVRALAQVTMLAGCAAVVACTPSSDAQSPSGAPQLPPQKTIATEGEACNPGGALHCANGLRCKEQPYTKPVLEAGATRTPADPNDVGGACGGVVGFHCADGLDCVMPPDQVMVADGMGSCALGGICVR